ncbi:superoxide dismutase [Candidatus Roizmanbacteria bacterium]|nr:superoxide dismutase [Candidatus Roizmanbacteria bacterium]
MQFTKYTAKTFSDSLMSMKGISKKTIEEHLKLYQGYILKYNEIMEKLSMLTADDYAKANQSYSMIRELKVELSFAYGGIANHEIYFAHLGGKGGKPSGEPMKFIKKYFGSLDTYKKDMKATGISARGWVWTAWNWKENYLFNYLGDAQNTFPVWHSTPVLALDTYEHAYFIDYGVNRGSYIDAFFENLNWAQVEKNFKAAGISL